MLGDQRDPSRLSLADLHPETRSVHQLFRAGFFAEALRSAAQRYINRVGDLVGPDELERRGQPSNLTGTRLIDLSFGGTNPVLAPGPRASRSRQSERDGYHQLARGLTLALRNVLSHDDEYVFDETEAFEWLAFISAMHRRLDQVGRTPRPPAIDPASSDATQPDA